MLTRSRVFFFGSVAGSAALFAFACSSSGVDTTEYGPPDSGQHPDANYCVSDDNCPADKAGNQFACGFPIASACEARGVCVGVSSTAQSCGPADYCGCSGDLVTTCPLTDTSYVRGGPTNGSKPTLVDGGLSCAK